MFVSVAIHAESLFHGHTDALASNTDGQRKPLTDAQSTGAITEHGILTGVAERHRHLLLLNFCHRKHVRRFGLSCVVIIPH